MSADPDACRECQIAAEQEEERDEALQEWLSLSLADLWEEFGDDVPF